MINKIKLWYLINYPSYQEDLTIIRLVFMRFIIIFRFFILAGMIAWFSVFRVICSIILEEVLI
jgi:hypothetical protein